MNIKRFFNPYTAFVMGSVVILALLVVVAPPSKNGKGGQHLKNSDYVTFDTVKYVNSRREMTARLIGDNEAQKQEAISVLATVEKSTRPAIEKHAKGKIVIVKQALVLNDQVYDITDDVLVELGLPTTSLTINPQDPTKILTPYSTSNEYARQKEQQANAQEYLEAKSKAFKEAKKEAQDEKRSLEMEYYLP